MKGERRKVQNGKFTIRALNNVLFVRVIKLGRIWMVHVERKRAIRNRNTVLDGTAKRGRLFGRPCCGWEDKVGTESDWFGSDH
jgi:hypothetical protein